MPIKYSITSDSILLVVKVRELLRLLLSNNALKISYNYKNPWGEDVPSNPSCTVVGI